MIQLLLALFTDGVLRRLCTSLSEFDLLSEWGSRKPMGTFAPMDIDFCIGIGNVDSYSVKQNVTYLILSEICILQLTLVVLGMEPFNVL